MNDKDKQAMDDSFNRLWIEQGITNTEIWPYKQGFSAGVAHRDAELAALREQVRTAKEALEYIMNPIGGMQKLAKAEGNRLNGMMATAIAKDANHLSEVAKKAFDAMEAQDE